jgi:hypothetical protein
MAVLAAANSLLWVHVMKRCKVKLVVFWALFLAGDT